MCLMIKIPVNKNDKPISLFIKSPIESINTMRSLQFNEIALPYIRAALFATREKPTVQTGLKIAEAAALADSSEIVKAFLAHSEQLGKSTDNAYRARVAAGDRVILMEKCMENMHEQVEEAMQRIKGLQQEIEETMQRINGLQQEIAYDAVVIKEMDNEMTQLKEESANFKDIWDTWESDELQPIWGGCEWDIEVSDH